MKMQPGESRVAALFQQEIEQTSLSPLLLDGRVIHPGDLLTLRIFDAWVSGVVQQDRIGWYLLTAAQVGIRLSAGLIARWVEAAPST